MHTSRNSLQFGWPRAPDCGRYRAGHGRRFREPGNPSAYLARPAPASRDSPFPRSAIGLPNAGALVQTAVFVAASETGNINGDFCKVTGIVKPHNPSSPNLEFEVNLPAAWNRRALQMGGGGYDGSLVTGLTQYSNQTPNSDTPLKQGYVTLGSDGGHEGKAGFDGSFGMDDEALLNFGKESVKKTHDAAMAVIAKGIRTAAGSGSTLSAARRAGMKRWMPPHAIRRTMTAWWRITRRTTSRCCTWDR